MSEDRFDALERGYEERQRAAQDLAGMLGVGSEAKPTAVDKPRDEQGRFIAGSADVAEHGAPVLPTPNMGALILALLDERS
jgi:hypothetical protein